MQWFYAKGGEQVGPLDDHAFHELVRSNQITADTPVWREGMPTWIPYGQVSGRRPVTTPKKKLVLARDAGSEGDDSPTDAPAGHADAMPADDAPSSPVQILIAPLYRGRRWIKLIGVLSILGGVLYAITIVGLIIAWLPIWMGVALNNAAKNLTLAYENNDEMAAVAALDKLRLYFKIMGVLAMLSLVAGLAGFLLGMLLPALVAGRHF